MPDSRVASSLLPIDRIYRPILFLYIKYIHKIAKPITQNSPTGKPLALENTLLNQVPLGKKILGMDPLQVTIFTCGTFETYEKQTGKKLHQMNPSYYDLKALLEVQECLNKVR